MPSLTLCYIVIARTWYGRKKAGQVVIQDWEWKLSDKLAALCTEEYTHPYGWYSLEKRLNGWYIVGHVGCAWDFATKFIAFKWIIEASLGHDILHWLIERGALPEAANDLIDEEFSLIAEERGGAPGWRQAYIECAVNLVDQKRGNPNNPIARQVYYLYSEAG